MKILYSPRFSRLYKKVPAVVKERLEKIEKVFRDDPFNASLKTHKLHGRLKDAWAFSVNKSYRIVFEFYDKDAVRLLAIGTHDIYQ